MIVLRKVPKGSLRWERFLQLASAMVYRMLALYSLDLSTSCTLDNVWSPWQPVAW